MCDQGHKVTFDSQKCEIRKQGSRKLIATLQEIQATYMC
jgi:hypothetical protein